MLEIWKFGNTDIEADELFDLVINGRKTATCSLYSNNHSPLEGLTPPLRRGQNSNAVLGEGCICDKGENVNLINANEKKEQIDQSDKNAVRGHNNTSKIEQRSYISNSYGSKHVLVEITNAEVKKFSDIDTEFAKKEGEGDLSLKYWQETHKQFFTEELAKQGKEFNKDILLLCEEFKVIEQLDRHSECSEESNQV